MHQEPGALAGKGQRESWYVYTLVRLLIYAKRAENKNWCDLRHHTRFPVGVAVVLLPEWIGIKIDYKSIHC